jgi:hypothetical protein
MKQEINQYDFAHAFHACGRGTQFSYEALELLYDYLNEYDNYMLDVIGICCDFIEEPLADALENAGVDTLHELERLTVVLGVTQYGVLYLNY